MTKQLFASKKFMFEEHFPRIPSMKEKVAKYEEEKQKRERSNQRHGLGAVDYGADIFAPRAAVDQEAMEKTK